MISAIQCSFILFLLLISSSFKDDRKSDKIKKSVVLVQLNYNSYGMRGYGGVLKIRNVEDNTTYVNKSKIGFNSFVMIPNLAIGRYIVEELQIVAGSNRMALTNKIYFDTLKLMEPKVYYLGNYLVEKVPPLIDLNFMICKMENDDEKKIYKQVKKDSESWLELKIDMAQQLFKADSTKVAIKNYR
jgi:hypothetical protein